MIIIDWFSVYSVLYTGQPTTQYCVMNSAPDLSSAYSLTIHNPSILLYTLFLNTTHVTHYVYIHSLLVLSHCFYTFSATDGKSDVTVFSFVSNPVSVWKLVKLLFNPGVWDCLTGAYSPWG